MEKLDINTKFLKNWQIERLEVFKKILNKIGDNFVLKGGTALLLYYGLDRFSEDVDLDAFSDNMNIYNKIKENNWEINEKKNTDTVYRIMLDYGAKNDNGSYPLKIEISSRNKNLLNSKSLKYSNINGVNVYNLDEILKMKLVAFGNRDKIRDFYDLSFFLEKEPNCFSNEMLKDLKAKMEYKDLDELAFLLNKEFEKNHLKKIVRGRVIHDQNIRNLRDLRAFQLLQHPLYIFLLIVCRNDNQQFFLFLLYHRIFLILSRKAAAPTAVPRSHNLQDALTPPARTPCAGPDSGSGSPQLPLPPQRQARTKSRPPRL